MAEDVADVSRIAFRPVVDEYFLRAEMNAARCVIVFNDGINQKVVSLFGAVSMKCIGVGYLVHCLVHRLDAGLRQWAGTGENGSEWNFFPDFSADVDDYGEEYHMDAESCDEITCVAWHEQGSRSVAGGS